MLDKQFTLRETFQLLKNAEQSPSSKFWFGSPCKFVRTCDVAVHIVLPELIENILPKFAGWLRKTSPRWGRSWRSW